MTFVMIGRDRCHCARAESMIADTWQLPCFCDINPDMAEHPTQRDMLRLLQLTAGLWLGYLLMLLAIDQTFYPRPVFPPVFYWINGLCALAVLGLTLWRHSWNWIADIFVRSIIALLSVLPILTANLAVLPLPPTQANGPEAITLRLTPLLLMALILTAWRYGFSYVIMFSWIAAVLMIVLQVSRFRPGGPSLAPPLTVILIQTLMFLVVGYLISALIQRLEEQRRSLAQANARLADYASTLEELTISRERNRMARELHDTLAHTLSALSVQLETVKAYWGVDPPAAQQMLDRSLDATRSGLQETRRALKSLRASPLDDLGLTLALRQMATEAAERSHLFLDLSVPEQLPVLPLAAEQCIYRIAQEAVANAAHHANARLLRLHLVLANGMTLEVTDDGVGFDPDHASVTGHFGLAGMRERAGMAGGELSIISRPGQGTVVRLTIQDAS